MFLDGEDLRSLPLIERKKRLRAILPKGTLVIYSEHWPEHGKRLFKKAEKLGLEGIMAKRADSRYLSGARSKDWLKIKTAKRQEAVIVGFTAPRRTRRRFGALVLAVREGNGLLAREAGGVLRQNGAIAVDQVSIHAADQG
jgi:bifunctional non-homologous end joining protein LigD